MIRLRFRSGDDDACAMFPSWRRQCFENLFPIRDVAFGGGCYLVLRISDRYGRDHVYVFFFFFGSVDPCYFDLTLCCWRARVYFVSSWY